MAVRSSSGGIGRREPCLKCGMPVFLAERLNVGKELYHRTCFRCARCNNQLSLANYYETETEGQYCCETCPDEEKRGTVQQQQPQPATPLTYKNVTDETKISDTDSYSTNFETALELPTLSETAYSNARSKFINTIVEDVTPQKSPFPEAEADETDETPPELPKSKPPDDTAPTLVHQENYESVHRTIVVNSDVNISDSVDQLKTAEEAAPSGAEDAASVAPDVDTKDVVFSSGSTSLVKARLKQFETKDVDKPTKISKENKVPSAEDLDTKRLDDDEYERSDVKVSFSDVDLSVDVSSYQEDTKENENDKKDCTDLKQENSSNASSEPQIAELDDSIISISDTEPSQDSKDKPEIHEDKSVIVISDSENVSINAQEKDPANFDGSTNLENVSNAQEKDPANFDSSTNLEPSEEIVVISDVESSKDQSFFSLEMSKESAIIISDGSDDSKEPEPTKKEKPSENSAADQNESASIAIPEDASTTPNDNKTPEQVPEIKLACPDKDDNYPVDLNPFGDEDEDVVEEIKKPVPAKRKIRPQSIDYKISGLNQDTPEELKTIEIERLPSMNPFEDTDEETVPVKKVLQAPKISFNPFWSDGEEPEDDEEEDKSKNMSGLNRGIHAGTPEARPRLSNLSATSGLHGSSSSISSLNSSLGHTPGRKKKPAPQPPSLKTDPSAKNSQSSSPATSVQSSPKAGPKHRKNRKAPLPPTSTPMVHHLSSDLTSITSTISPIDNIIRTPSEKNSPLSPEANVWEIEKTNKDERNRNRQSQGEDGVAIIDSNDVANNIAAYPDKSTYGKWKRKKGPAPARPVPQRRTIKAMPIEEVKRQLEVIELQQQGLEKQGVRLEQIIRDRCETANVDPDTSMDPEVEDLVLQLFELVNEKNELFRKQAELMYLRRQQRLEEEHADLEYQIRCLMDQPEANKTDSDKSREEDLIRRLVDIVERRNEIIECLEMDRVRENQEDDSISSHLSLLALKREEESLEKSKQQQSPTGTVKTEKQKKSKKDKLKLISKLKGSNSSSSKMDADKDIDESETSSSSAVGVGTTDTMKKKKKKWFS